MCYNKPMTDSWRLESFEWLSIEQWSVDKLTGPILGNKSMCKICDRYIDLQGLDSHVKKHLKEYEKLKKKKRRASEEKRKESLRLAREVRKSRKDREKQEKNYLEGDTDE